MIKIIIILSLFVMRKIKTQENKTSSVMTINEV